MPKKELTKLIEQKRAELIQIAGRYGLSSRAAIIRSQELDLLLNEYHRSMQSQHKKILHAK